MSATIAATAGAGKATQEIWGEMRDSSWEGLQQMYEKGEISKEQIETFATIRNLTDEEWSQIKEDYLDGIIGKDEFEQIKQIRQMPEEWTTAKNGIKGITYGVANGVWEGVQWYVGGKFAQWKPEGLSKILTSVTRVGYDTAFNAMDTPYRTLLDMLMKDKDLAEAWNDRGGSQAMLTDIGIGLIGSIGGEVFDSVKNKKETIKAKQKYEGIYKWYQLEGEDSKIKDVVKSIEESTNSMYDKTEFRDMQFSIFETLRKSGVEEMEAAVFTAKVMEQVINDRGGFETIKQVNGISINAIKDINWQNVNHSLEDIVDYIEKMPKELRESVKAINISDLTNTMDPYWSVQYKQEKFISACTGGYGQINIYSKNNDINALLHEAGHCLDSKYGYISNVLGENSWNSAMTNDFNLNGKIGVTQYAEQAKTACNTNVEDFAEAIQLFCLNKTEFAKNFPNRFNYLNQVFRE